MKRLLRSCIFLALLCGVLAGVTRLVERKESANQFGPFLKEPKAYDVLFFGDSRGVNSILPMELWKDYGIAGYNLSCYGNTMPVTYWSMMNALDYASPKLVVIAVNGIRQDLKVTGSSSDVHTALDFYPLSLTKIRAIEDLMDDPDAQDDDGNRYVQMKWEYLFTLGKYHERWSRLTADDFVARPSVQRGAEMMVGVAGAKEYDIIDDDLYAEESGISYGYLRGMIEECQNRGIEVLLVHLPYPASAAAQMCAHTVGSIAEEYGVNYVDFVCLDSVVDYAVDCYDAQTHLNASGARKVTDYLGRYICDHYDLPQRRGDARYARWAQEADVYAEEKLQLIRSQTEHLDDLLMLLHDGDFGVRLAIRPGAHVYDREKTMLLMHNIAREHVFEENEYACWSNAMFPLTALDEACAERSAYYLSAEGGAVREERGAAAEAEAARTFGAKAQGDVMIQVIDRRTGETAAQMQFPAQASVSL